MSLSAALNTAKSSLAASQLQTQIVSSNIANVNTAGATRKIANVVTGAGGGVTVSSISQASNSVLFRNMLDATSKLQVAVTQSDAYSRINEILGDTAAKESPQARIAALNDALSTLANTPGNFDLARNAVQAAQDVVTTIRTHAATVDTIRRDADDGLVVAAADMQQILAELETVNRQIVQGTNKGQDITDQSDQRDRLVTQLSQYVGVSVQLRGSNDMVIYTDSGVTLLENTARSVSYQSTNSLAPGAEGNSFYIDGVAVTGEKSYMPVKTGKIAGLTEVRDEIANTYGAQLDELARGLVSAFSEFDPSGTGVAKTGLFTSTVDMSTTTGPVSVGAFTTPGAFAADKDVSFTVTYEGTTYQASGTLTAADLASEAAFASRLQSLVAGAKTTTGATLGAGRISVTSTGTALSMSATGVGDSIGFAISGLSANMTAAGVTAGTGTPDPEPVYRGLSSNLTIAAGLGADPTLVRDGVNYQYNPGSPTKLGGFSDRIVALGKALDTARSFSSDAGANPKATLAGYAASSIGWVQQSRTAASNSATSMTTLVNKTNETLSSETGINLDVELTRLIELERSYQASAKIISTVDQMLAQLLQSI
ncbi:flagellar hook-associated protein FlgK [Aureimonas phyllosphaerae]|uniref:Flagellar hook-associated protein 1 n=1 Tax=Aureimonas phyllosphaerae TaxID=1166078 RepID=A0A7W6BT37_9HYPH|nr:flagellar hook-associated protein FlgK [Aureimonas phyllosphaerae]MBB3935559.1 flagellar hook-associated protein 1 FlgK [Aureimonas phyllosphaerae]MBB3959567.1 flagellar hook-associated protein 1 FlgK [Aureimonas phyllosphaerae]SFF12264.1 flagellar hook-associated protein 1 FlgK [Aureimonas phyllosphaerae]